MMPSQPLTPPQPSPSFTQRQSAGVRGGWSVSSLDLLDGADVVESDDATLSALFDTSPPAALPPSPTSQADPTEPL